VLSHDKAAGIRAPPTAEICSRAAPAVFLVHAAFLRVGRARVQPDGAPPQLHLADTLRHTARACYPVAASDFPRLAHFFVCLRLRRATIDRAAT
jgi:hypothetical protein